MKLRSLWRKRKDVMKFNDKEAESKARQEAALQALHDENVRLGLYEGVYAIDVLEQENRLLRARNDRLEKELAMYQVQRLGQEIQPERDYERGFIDGMQKQMQSSVDKAVNRLAQPEQEPVAWKETDKVECPVCKDKGFPWPKCGHITYLEPTPPQRTWVGLTEEDIDDAEIHLTSCRNNHESWIEGIQEFAQAIEAKLKEKNT